jgi:hypothetical protein
MYDVDHDRDDTDGSLYNVHSSILGWNTGHSDSGL